MFFLCHVGRKVEIEWPDGYLATAENGFAGHGSIVQLTEELPINDKILWAMLAVNWFYKINAT
ncbi:hypothetical protein H8K35_16510 [Undibacterium sp. LX40W]|uniref:Uncharacterized protein n=1 Tax=Undibacterium nitidum TaxID=2762298 RepID=A0A923HNV4_9BURK|nr:MULTISPECIES: hypothetical protein [Undibacterium]MBC3883000.1 hypothetical protein [Undibacterium nitidum]MBC3893281.1 hypothetical protein [Undibacterium sp. LX40W]